MKLNFILAAAAGVALAGCSSFPASEPKQSEEHKAHHPAAESATAVDPAKFNQQMKAMQDMHQKMMAAKTPAERAALMKDHMKTMQEGMAMMGQMGGGPMMGQKGGGMPMQGGGMSSTPGGPSMQKDMMRRMDMMEMMMQMMVDREGVMPPAAK
jgi:outer membrane murein-binding lipoprotein Lpp